MQHIAGPEHHRVDQSEREQRNEAPRVDRDRVLGLAFLQTPQLDREADAEQQAEHAVELAREQHVAHELRTLVPRLRPQVRAVGLDEERVGEARHVHDQDPEQREAAHDVECQDPLAGGQRVDAMVHGLLPLNFRGAYSKSESESVRPRFRPAPFQ